MLRAERPVRAASRTVRQTWLDHAIVAVAFGLLLSGFASTIAGSDWWMTTVLVSTLTGLTCAVLRAIGVRWVAPIAVLVELLALSWIFVPDTLTAVLPTPSTIRELGVLASQAQDIIIEEQAPVAAARPVVLVVASAFGFLVIVADALLVRRRATAAMGVLFVAVFATPALISGDTPSVWLFVAVAGLWLVILRSRTAMSAGPGAGLRGPALVLGAGAIAAAVAFPLISPDVSAVAASWGKPPPTVFGRGINPMLELGQNLRRDSTVTALTYTTRLDQAPYLKVATLRDFTGKTWKPGATQRFDVPEGEEAVDRDIETARASTTITIKQLRTDMLPVPYPLLDVTGLKGRWVKERFGLTMHSGDNDTRGQKYSVTSLEVRPTADRMRAVRTFVGMQLQEDVRLPRRMPRVIEATARRVTAGSTNDYDRVLALQTYLRNGSFTYSETAPVADGYDGNGVDVIAEFLDKKAGYCVHFSSAMAVMARTLGIPSRIAVGYAPGTVIGVRDERTEYAATSDDLHAWTEIYFEGVGWVPFDPTPGVGSATAFDEPDAGTSNVDPGSAPGTNGGQEPSQRNSVDSVNSTAVSSSRTAPRTAVITSGVLLVLVVVPSLVRSARRRWRLRGAVHSPSRLWIELELTARDFAIPVTASDTPRAFASVLAGWPGMDREALGGLLSAVERERFGPPGEAVEAMDDFRTVMSRLRSGATRRERVRAAMFPRSLVGTTKYPQKPLVAAPR